MAPAPLNAPPHKTHQLWHLASATSEDDALSLEISLICSTGSACSVHVLLIRAVCVVFMCLGNCLFFFFVVFFVFVLYFWHFAGSVHSLTEVGSGGAHIVFCVNLHSGTFSTLSITWYTTCYYWACSLSNLQVLGVCSACNFICLVLRVTFTSFYTTVFARVQKVA